jgi:ribosomal protein S18 acetylase RimI-like enzyme
VEVRSLSFRTDVMVRRLAGASVVDRGDHLVVRTPANPGFHWGNFLLLDTLPVGPAVDEWITAFRHEFPGTGHVALGIDGTTFPDPLELPPSVGFEVDLGVVLTGNRPPTPRPTPDGLTVRPLRSARDWREELRLRRAEQFEDGPPPPGHTEYLLRRTAEASGLAAAGRATYLGAFDGDRLCAVVGIASDGRGVARYQNVATRAGFRRQGLASLLVTEAGRQAVSSMGAELLVIVADRGSDAARLYEALGFAPVESTLGLTLPPHQAHNADRTDAGTG